MSWRPVGQGVFVDDDWQIADGELDDDDWDVVVGMWALALARQSAVPRRRPLPCCCTRAPNI